LFWAFYSVGMARNSRIPELPPPPQPLTPNQIRAIRKSLFAAAIARSD